MARGPVRIKPGFSAKHYSWIEVGALCDAILKAASDPEKGEQHGPLYLGGEGTITDAELIDTAAEVIGSRGVTLAVPQALIRIASLAVDAVPAWRAAAPSIGIDRVREILPNRWVCDATPFREAFGCNLETNLRETLAETAAWLKAQGKI
jgi:nucleoside-diphosphate-sugar epimerase